MAKESVQHKTQMKCPVIQINAIKQNYLFAKTRFQNYSLQFLIDTGSVATVISRFSFDKLGLSTDLLQKVQTTLTAVDGEEVNVYGKLNFPIKFLFTSLLWQKFMKRQESLVWIF